MKVEFLPAAAVIGMVHLKPLPGSPRFAGDMAEVVRFALADAEALVAGGIDAILVENFHDSPFHPEQVEPVTIAAMSRIVSQIVNSIAEPAGIPVGVNVLRNDAAAALSIAAACGADFIRVNVHTGAMLTDQGVINGQAADTLRLRESLGKGVNSEKPIAILADVGVKHATPMERGWLIEREASDCWNRGGADALIVSGDGTGRETSLEDLAKVRMAVPNATILAGSGITSENISKTLELADGAIVGTGLKEGAILTNPVNADSVQNLISNR